MGLIIVLLFCFLLTACGYKESSASEIEGFAMGTVILQRIYHGEAKSISKKVMDRLGEIEPVMTINREGGEMNSLNQAAGSDYVKLSGETLYVLNKAKTYSELSKGSFDVTVGPLVKAWGIYTDNQRVPEKEEINNLLNLVNYKKISINTGESKAKLEFKGQIADLGGIAKGYAGDEAIKIYRDNGVKSAFISLGGNVVALGGKPDGSPWKIGVRDPRGPEGSYLGIISVKDKAVVSSGDYERYFERDNKRYHHILDPKTGYPANSGLIGTTIISELSIDADALSTSVFVLGLEEGLKLIESLDGVEAILITEDKKVYTSKGLKDVFEFTNESKEYEYVEKR